MTLLSIVDKKKKIAKKILQLKSTMIKYSKRLFSESSHLSVDKYIKDESLFESYFCAQRLEFDGSSKVQHVEQTISETDGCRDGGTLSSNYIVSPAENNNSRQQSELKDLKHELRVKNQEIYNLKKLMKISNAPGDRHSVGRRQSKISRRKRFGRRGVAFSEDANVPSVEPTDLDLSRAPKQSSLSSSSTSIVAFTQSLSTNHSYGIPRRVRRMATPHQVTPRAFYRRSPFVHRAVYGYRRPVTSVVTSDTSSITLLSNEALLASNVLSSSVPVVHHVAPLVTGSRHTMVPSHSSSLTTVYSSYDSPSMLSARVLPAAVSIRPHVSRSAIIQSHVPSPYSASIDSGSYVSSCAYPAEVPTVETRDVDVHDDGSMTYINRKTRMRTETSVIDTPIMKRTVIQSDVPSVARRNVLLSDGTSMAISTTEMKPETRVIETPTVKRTLVQTRRPSVETQLVNIDVNGFVSVSKNRSCGGASSQSVVVDPISSSVIHSGSGSSLSTHNVFVNGTSTGSMASIIAPPAMVVSVSSSTDSMTAIVPSDQPVKLIRGKSATEDLFTSKRRKPKLKSPRNKGRHRSGKTSDTPKTVTFSEDTFTGGARKKARRSRRSGSRKPKTASSNRRHRKPILKKRRYSPR